MNVHQFNAVNIYIDLSNCSVCLLVVSSHEHNLGVVMHCHGGETRGLKIPSSQNRTSS